VVSLCASGHQYLGTRPPHSCTLVPKYDKTHALCAPFLLPLAELHSAQSSATQSDLMTLWNELRYDASRDSPQFLVLMRGTIITIVNVNTSTGLYVMNISVTMSRDSFVATSNATSLSPSSTRTLSVHLAAETRCAALPHLYTVSLNRYIVSTNLAGMWPSLAGVTASAMSTTHYVLGVGKRGGISGMNDAEELDRQR
jgi:hypothetical protein